MGIILTGTDYKTAPIKIREKVSVSGKILQDILKKLLSIENIEGAVVLSTCNRMEVYVSCNGVEHSSLIDFIMDYFSLSGSSKTYFYTLTGYDLIRHLFRVASGLESQIIGESEILGQVKNAYFLAHAAGCTDKTINKIFTKAIEIGKKVRTETQISRGNISYGSVIFSIAREVLGTIDNANVVLIGTGKMASVIIKYLTNKKTNVTVVSSRHFDIAMKLASSVGGKAIMFDEITQAINTADLIISSSNAPHLILKRSHFEGRANYNQLLIFDIAVPRNVEPEVKNMKGIYLYDIDSLTAIIEKNIEMRRKEEIVAQQLIDEEIKKFIWRVENV